MIRRSEQLLLFSEFHKAGAEYTVAVDAHGFVRATRDLDLFIRPSKDNARAAFNALQCLGAPLERLGHTDLLVDYEHDKLSTPDNTVDILTSIGGMSFDDVWNDRVDVEVEGIPSTSSQKQT